jgi:hypothetical protein
MRPSQNASTKNLALFDLAHIASMEFEDSSVQRHFLGLTRSTIRLLFCCGFS